MPNGECILGAISATMPSMPNKRRSVEYLTMVGRLWGNHISGPILALVAIIAVFVNALYANDATTTATVAKYIAWITGGISGFLVFVAQYQTWDKERDKYEAEARKLEEIEKAKPNMRLKEPGGVYVEPVFQRFTHKSPDGKLIVRDQTVPYLKVRFINDPKEPYPSANASGVRAYIDFYRLPDNTHILSIDGRWAESDQPPAYSPLSSKAPLLAATFGIGESKSVDIAYRDRGGKYYAWNNDNYNYVDQFYVYPHHLLEGERFRVNLRLRGNWIDLTHSFIFRTEGDSFAIEA